MSDNQEINKPSKPNWFLRFDGLIKKYIPNFNARAILYLSVIFAVAVYLQIWRISAPKPPETKKNNETVIADNSYWQSQEYKNKIKSQTVDSFTAELQKWLAGQSQEFVRRKFEDMLYINTSLTPLTGGDLSVVVPENFNYLENFGRAKYQYAKDHNFMADQPTLVKLGQVVCDLDDKTEKAANIELYDWRYASMPKLAEFMKSKPDWKYKVGDKILDISDPVIEDKDILSSRNTQTQPVGLFSYLIFRDTQTNRIYLADTNILDENAVEAKMTLARISSKMNPQPKIYFKYGYEGCKQINSDPQVNYGQSN